MSYYGIAGLMCILVFARAPFMVKYFGYVFGILSLVTELVSHPPSGLAFISLSLTGYYFLRPKPPPRPAPLTQEEIERQLAETRLRLDKEREQKKAQEIARRLEMEPLYEELRKQKPPHLTRVPMVPARGECTCRGMNSECIHCGGSGYVN